MARRGFRPYLVTPAQDITIEVHAANGQVFTLRGRVDSVPWVAAEHAQKIVVVDAVAEPGPVDEPGEQRPDEDRDDGR